MYALYGIAKITKKEGTNAVTFFGHVSSSACKEFKKTLLQDLGIRDFERMWENQGGPIIELAYSETKPPSDSPYEIQMVVSVKYYKRCKTFQTKKEFDIFKLKNPDWGDEFVLGHSETEILKPFDVE